MHNNFDKLLHIIEIVNIILRYLMPIVPKIANSVVVDRRAAPTTGSLGQEPLLCA